MAFLHTHPTSYSYFNYRSNPVKGRFEKQWVAKALAYFNATRRKNLKRGMALPPAQRKAGVTAAFVIVASALARSDLQPKEKLV